MRDRPTRWPAGRQLWTLVAGVALFDVALTVAADRMAGGGPSVARGQDFMAFYTAGRLAAEGRLADVYDLVELARVQRAIAAEAGLAETSPLSPWLNPPHAALLFVPFAQLGFRAALALWTLLGIACLAASATILSRIVGEASPLRRHRWLVVACAFASPPALAAIGHGQNTPLSLLLLTLAVAAWRADRPTLAGAACALLAYKPHLAAAVALACVASQGPRVLLGFAAAGAALLAATLALLPGALTAYAARMPANAHAIFVARGFNWHRHVTFVGFTRHLLHGNGPGEAAPWIAWAAASLVAVVVVMLALIWWRLRPALRAGDASARDRWIVAAVLATPLVAPYFMDYDLLLPLCVAGALVGRDALLRGDAWLRRLAMVAYAWLVVNALVADAIGASLTTPLLALLFALHVRRCWTSAAASAVAIEELKPLRRAA